MSEHEPDCYEIAIQEAEEDHDRAIVAGEFDEYLDPGEKEEAAARLAENVHPPAPESRFRQYEARAAYFDEAFRNIEEEVFHLDERRRKLGEEFDHLTDQAEEELDADQFEEIFGTGPGDPGKTP